MASPVTWSATRQRRVRGFDLCICYAGRRPSRLHRPAQGRRRRARRQPGHLVEVLIVQMVNLVRDGQLVR